MVTKQEELATKKDLGELEGRLTTQIGANAAKINGNATKIDANAAKIDQVEKNLSAKIDANAAKIDRVERNLGAKIDANSEAISKLTSLALENKDELKKMATKEDMDKRLDEVVSILDGLAHSFSILEQEKVVVNKRLDRIEAKLA